MSGLSTLRGRKTSENEHTSSSTFRAKTIEPAGAPTYRSQGPLPMTILVTGKKRAAPNDGDVDEPAPFQGFTSDGVLAVSPGLILSYTW